MHTLFWLEKSEGKITS